MDMSREIKFRAWLPGIKKMTHTHTLDELMNWDTKPGDNGTAEWLQFTGLKDKNGKEIYEGDRFQNGKSVGTIIYEEDSYNVNWDEPNVEFWNEHLKHHVKNGLVIGNIYEEVSKDEDTTSRESSPDEAEEETAATE
jgi:hypothetical protein